MKIAILSTQTYPSLGHDSVFIHHLSSAIVQRGHRVVVAGSISGESKLDGVEYISYPPLYSGSTEDRLTSISMLEADYLILYGDHCPCLPLIVKNFSRIKPRVCLILRGASVLKTDTVIRSLFFDRKENIDVVVHSEGEEDYCFCVQNGIDVNIIPMGIDLSRIIQTRKKEEYLSRLGIRNKKVVLYDESFYFGKGHEHFLTVLKGLAASGHECCGIIIARKTGQHVCDVLSNMFPDIAKASKVDVHLLMDPNERETIDAYYASDVYFHASLRDVFPFPILKAMACGLPWVSFCIDGVAHLDGGVVVSGERATDGMVSFNQDLFGNTVSVIDNVLRIEKDREEMICSGKNVVKNRHEIGLIADKYLKMIDLRKENNERD